MADPATTTAPPGHPADAGLDTEFSRGLGLFDSTMVVVGTMIGSGIFIVSAFMGRLVGSPGWLLVAWLATGVLTVAAALSYGELAGMMPRAGGQYVYLREAFSPLWGFLYGWTLFLVIQTGLIAAVAVAFARFLGVFWPWVSEGHYLIGPIHLSQGYAVSLSSAQLIAILMIAVLTGMNMGGLRYGKWVQNLFTVAKTGALIGLIVLGLTLGWNASAVSDNFGNFWTARPAEPVVAGKEDTLALSAYWLFVALCVSQTGSLFSADAWNCITFTAGEVRNPRRNLPLSLALGTSIVILLYLLANLAYLVTLPFADILNAPSDRVGSAAMERIFPGVGAGLMAAAILVSTFGCNNGLILAGARAYYAMARDRLFFRPAGALNAARVPGWGLLLQGLWACVLVLPRTVLPFQPSPTDMAGSVGLLAAPAGHSPLLAVSSLAVTHPQKYGNLYNNLLDYIISAALLFYVLTIAGIFRLRKTRPDAHRPYRAFGYPVVPALYIIGALVLFGMLVVYRQEMTWPGMVIVALGVPVYFLWRRGAPAGAGE
jgi:APA family basic amino acid/polyamine antiporter